MNAVTLIFTIKIEKREKEKVIGFECPEVSKILLNYLLHHLSLAFGPPVTAGNYL